MTPAELRDQTVEPVNDELSSLLREQFNLRMQLGTQQLKQVHKLKAVRRNIARVKTLLRERVGKSS